MMTFYDSSSNQHVNIVAMTARVDTCPECVGFVMGKNKSNLKIFCNTLKNQTGRSVYIEYVQPNHMDNGHWLIHGKHQEDVNFSGHWILKRELIFLRNMIRCVSMPNRGDSCPNVRMTVEKPTHVRFDENGDRINTNGKTETQELHEMIERLHC